jgi:Protein of unknown function (DUF2785)
MPAATWLALVLASPLSAGAAAPAEREARDPAFWEGIVASHYAVPEGESPASLMAELTTLLASPDPKLRDTYGYGIAVAWIYRDTKLSPPELKTLVSEWTANLGRGLGSTGTDDVFRRSFSALDLSLLAALDLKRPFLAQADFERLLSAALDYLAGERDLRAYDATKGWIHATAHTADLVKFLARNDKLAAPEQQRIVDAIEAKLGGVDVAFTHGEDERLASALASLASRADASPTLLDPWLARLSKTGAELWRNEPLVDPAEYRSVQNQENALKNLHVILSVRALDRPLTGSAAAIDKAILATLKGL